MSTDIVRYQASNKGVIQKTVSPEALWLFMELSLPLTLATFLAWYGVYWYITWEEEKRKRLGSLRSA
jgi:hypothetical protein